MKKKKKIDLSNITKVITLPSYHSATRLHTGCERYNNFNTDPSIFFCNFTCNLKGHQGLNGCTSVLRKFRLTAVTRTILMKNVTTVAANIVNKN